MCEEDKFDVRSPYVANCGQTIDRVQCVVRQSIHLRDKKSQIEIYLRPKRMMEFWNDTKSVLCLYHIYTMVHTRYPTVWHWIFALIFFTRNRQSCFLSALPEQKPPKVQNCKQKRPEQMTQLQFHWIIRERWISNKWIRAASTASTESMTVLRSSFVRFVVTYCLRIAAAARINALACTRRVFGCRCLSASLPRHFVLVDSFN